MVAKGNVVCVCRVMGNKGRGWCMGKGCDMQGAKAVRFWSGMGRSRLGKDGEQVVDEGVTPRPKKLHTWQPPRALKWVLVSQVPSKDSQGI